MKIKEGIDEIQGGCVEEEDVIRHTRLMKMHL